MSPSNRKEDLRETLPRDTKRQVSESARPHPQHAGPDSEKQSPEPNTPME